MYRKIIAAGEPYVHEFECGQIVRIVDLEGNQAVDTLFYNACDTEERYDANNTIREQGNIYLTTGTALWSNLGNVMLRIVADTCGRHDTLGGACSAESNTVRYALEKRHMHSCRDNFLLALARHDRGLTKRDLPSNMAINAQPLEKVKLMVGVASENGSQSTLRGHLDFSAITYGRIRLIS